MEVTDVGIKTEVREVQESKTASTIAVTDVGIKTEVREVQEEKA